MWRFGKKKDKSSSDNKPETSSQADNEQVDGQIKEEHTPQTEETIDNINGESAAAQNNDDSNVPKSEDIKEEPGSETEEQKIEEPESKTDEIDVEAKEETSSIDNEGDSETPPPSEPEPGMSDDEMRPAGFWARMVAFQLDMFIISMIILAAELGVAAALSVDTLDFTHLFLSLSSPENASLVSLISVVVPLLYIILFWIGKGSTPGKMLLGMKIKNTTGGRLSPLRSIARAFSYIVSYPIFMIGFIWAAFNSRKMAWHDYISGSRVVYEGRSSVARTLIAIFIPIIPIPAVFYLYLSIGLKSLDVESTAKMEAALTKGTAALETALNQGVMEGINTYKNYDQIQLTKKRNEERRLKKRRERAAARRAEEKAKTAAAKKQAEIAALAEKPAETQPAKPEAQTEPESKAPVEAEKVVIEAPNEAADDVAKNAIDEVADDVLDDIVIDAVAKKEAAEAEDAKPPEVEPEVKEEEIADASKEMIRTETEADKVAKAPVQEQTDETTEEKEDAAPEEVSIVALKKDKAIEPVEPETEVKTDETESAIKAIAKTTEVVEIIEVAEDVDVEREAAPNADLEEAPEKTEPTKIALQTEKAAQPETVDAGLESADEVAEAAKKAIQELKPIESQLEVVPESAEEVAQAQALEDSELTIRSAQKEEIEKRPDIAEQKIDVAKEIEPAKTVEDISTQVTKVEQVEPAPAEQKAKPEDASVTDQPETRKVPALVRIDVPAPEPSKSAAGELHDEYAGMEASEQEKTDAYFAESQSETESETAADIDSINEYMGEPIEPEQLQREATAGISAPQQAKEEQIEVAVIEDKQEQTTPQEINEQQEVAPVLDAAETEKEIIDVELAGNHYDAGLKHFNGDNMELAEQFFKKAIKANPEFVDAHAMLGEVYDKRGMFDNAIDEFNSAVEIEPDHVKSLFNLGFAYYQKGENESAIDYLKKAIYANPNSADTRALLGVVYQRANMLKKALAAHKTALKLDPLLTESRINMGNIYYKMNDYKSAIKAYKKAVKLNPKLAEPHNSLGYIYYEQGKDERAIREFKKAVRLKYDYIRAHNNLSLAYRRAGMNKEADNEQYIASTLAMPE